MFAVCPVVWIERLGSRCSSSGRAHLIHASGPPGQSSSLSCDELEQAVTSSLSIIRVQPFVHHKLHFVVSFSFSFSNNDVGFHTRRLHNNENHDFMAR